MISVETFSSNGDAGRALGADSIYLGGGTLVMRALNYGEQSFSRIIRSSDPALKRIETQGDKLQLGAGLTMSDILASAELSYLHAPAKAVGGPAIRNMATIGGNLFAEHPYGDFATALLALNGIVQFENGQTANLESFFASRKSMTNLVTSVTIDRPNINEFRWLKITRVKPKGVSVMSIAVWLPQSSGRLNQLRIAFGAMGPTPLRAKNAERALEGQNLDQQAVASAMAALSGDFQPPDDPLATGWYRNQVAPVHLRRLLLNEGGL